MANPFALSENGTMLSTVSRLDSAVLPRSEEGFPSRAPTRRNTPPPDILEDAQAQSPDMDSNDGDTTQFVLPAVMLDSILLNTPSANTTDETPSDLYARSSGDSSKQIDQQDIVDRTFRTAQEEAIAARGASRLASETSQDSSPDVNSTPTEVVSSQPSPSSSYLSKLNTTPMGRSLSNVSTSSRSFKSITSRPSDAQQIV